MFHVKLAAAAAAVMFLTSCGAKPLHRTTFALDTAVSITIFPADEKAAENAMDIIRSADNCFSKVCGGSNEPLTAEDAENVRRVYEVTQELNNKYDGGIDLFMGRLTKLWGISGDAPKLPSDDEISEVMYEIAEGYPLPSEGEYAEYADFGCAAKGYACDMAAAALKDIDGYAVLSAGSSSVMTGEKKGGFSVKIRSPAESGKYLGEFTCPAGFVSTSGGYERFFEAEGKKYIHIFDDKTGYPVETDLASVTVYFPLEDEYGGLKSDVLSTMIFCGGTAELEKYASDGISIVAADNSGNVYAYGIDFRIDSESGYSLWNSGS